MSYDNIHLDPMRVRADGSPPRIIVRAADDAAFVIGTLRPSSSKTRVLNWKDPILQACAAGDSRSLRIMYAEAQASVLHNTEIPSADEMFLAAISEGRIPILKDIHDLVPEYEWSDQVFIEAMKSDFESGGNHYLLALARWSRNPLRVQGEHNDLSPLMWAVRLGDLETAVVLLSWGASPNGCRYQNKYSYLQVAASMYGTAKSRYPPMLSLLMQYGAEKHGTGILSWTTGTLGYMPHIQSKVNARDIVGHMLHQGVDINERPPNLGDDRFQQVLQVPLIAATISGSAFMVEFLIYHGPDLSIKDTNLGKTAYEIACLPESSPYQPDLLDTFVKYGVSPATLWGILDSDLKKTQPSPCKCNKVNFEHDARWVPAQRTDF